MERQLQAGVVKLFVFFGCGLGFSDLGFRVQGFRIQGFRVFGFRVADLGFRDYEI